MATTTNKNQIHIFEFMDDHHRRATTHQVKKRHQNKFKIKQNLPPLESKNTRQWAQTC